MPQHRVYVAGKKTVMQWFGMAMAYSDFGSYHDGMQPACIAVFSNYCQKFSHFCMQHSSSMLWIQNDWSFALCRVSLCVHACVCPPYHVHTIYQHLYVNLSGIKASGEALSHRPWRDTLFGKDKRLSVWSLSLVPFTWERKTGQTAIKPDSQTGC